MPSHINDHTAEGQHAKSLADLHTKIDSLADELDGVHAKLDALVPREPEPKKTESKKAES